MPGKLRGLRWWIIGLVMLGGILNYLTRNTLSVAAPTILTELHISAKEYSWIVNAFQATIMLQPIAGYVLDVIGLKLGAALFCIAWSVICMAHGLAGSWQAFAWLRGALGLAEGSVMPTGMKATAEWFPAKERGLSGGIFNVGASLGAMLAPPLVIWAIQSYNWETAFVITGALGFVWVALWLLFYDSPLKHRLLSTKERDYIVSGQETSLQAAGARPNVWDILKRRNFWGIGLPRFLADPTWGTLSYWVPLYLTQARHFDLKHIAMFAWLPFLAADLGCLFGPSIVLFLQRRGIRLITARKCAFTVGATMMTGVAFAGFVANPYLAIALISLAGFAHQTLSITVITMSSDLFKKNEVGTVAGLQGMCGNFGLLLFNTVIGLLVASVGYTPFFVAMAVLDLIGAAVLWSFVKAGQDAEQSHPQRV
jgi:ACS family hexuronate transporter-like MFS transporter